MSQREVLDALNQMASDLSSLDITGVAPLVVQRDASGVRIRNDSPQPQWLKVTSATSSVVGLPGSRAVTDGVTTLNSQTVTSATASFTSGDVGARIGGTGIPLGATITAINSSSSVEISANATAANTGVTLVIGAQLRGYQAVIDTWLGAGDGINITWNDNTGNAWLLGANGEVPALHARYRCVLIGADVAGLGIWVVQYAPQAWLETTSGTPQAIGLPGSRSVTDGVLNGTSTVTSATANFVSGDVGAQIGGGSIPTGATISSVVSSTSVTISSAATSSAAGVTLVVGKQLQGYAAEIESWDGLTTDGIAPIWTDGAACYWTADSYMPLAAINLFVRRPPNTRFQARLLGVAADGLAIWTSQPGLPLYRLQLPAASTIANQPISGEHLGSLNGYSVTVANYSPYGNAGETVWLVYLGGSGSTNPSKIKTTTAGSDYAVYGVQVDVDTAGIPIIGALPHPPASAANWGTVTTGDQVFAGLKIFDTAGIGSNGYGSSLHDGSDLPTGYEPSYLIFAGGAPGALTIRGYDASFNQVVAAQFDVPVPSVSRTFGVGGPGNTWAFEVRGDYTDAFLAIRGGNTGWSGTATSTDGSISVTTVGGVVTALSGSGGGLKGPVAELIALNNL